MADQNSTQLVLLKVSFSDGTVSFEIGWAVAALLIVICIGSFAFHAAKTGKFFRKSYEWSELAFGTGGSTLTFKPSYGDRELAYKIWVELSTRKIGLKIDPENDVIIQIFNSWYAFFQVTREMIKVVPVSQVRDAESRKIINLSIDVLNLGLRPHLTLWQARFRSWYEQAARDETNAGLSPQDLQKAFPDYEALMTDMTLLNAKLESYRNKMGEIVFD